MATENTSMRKQQMKAKRNRQVKKAVPARNSRPQYQGRKAAPARRGSKKLYFIMIALLAAIVTSILSCTILFDLRTITVVGDTRYSPQEVIGASGISTGMNLVRLNTKKAKEAIQKKLPYAETVKISKKFPFDLVISVAEPTLVAAVQSGNQIYIISGQGRVLEEAESTAGYLVFEGLELTEGENGLVVSDLKMLDRLVKVVKAIQAQQIEKVTMVRSSSSSDCTFIYDGRITVKLGSLDELEYKMKFASYLLANKIRSDERGVLDATVPGEGKFNPENADEAQPTQEDESVPSASSAVSSGGEPNTSPASS